MKRNLPYSVPEGYFESLGSRLSGISSTSRRPAFRPVYALAAAALAVLFLVVGVALGGKPTTPTAAPVQVSEADAIVEYLIESGASLCYLEDVIS